MPLVGFESTISVLERAKTVRALDRAATAIGSDFQAIYFLELKKTNGKIEIDLFDVAVDG
jgi:hypothetical protein